MNIHNNARLTPIARERTRLRLRADKRVVGKAPEMRENLTLSNTTTLFISICCFVAVGAVPPNRSPVGALPG